MLGSGHCILWAKKKGTINGEKTRFKVMCDNKNDKDSSAHVLSLCECPRIFLSSSPKNRLWKVKQLLQQVSDGEGLKLSLSDHGPGY